MIPPRLVLALVLCAGAPLCEVPLRAQSPDSARAATFDERTAAWWQAPERQHNAALRTWMHTADVAASPGILLAAPVAYGALRLAGQTTGATYALRTAEAMVLGTVVTSTLKAIAGRARPSASARSDDFALGRGLHGASYQSFPSGHTTVAFAAASALTLAVADHDRSAGAAVGVVMLAGAMSAGAARLYLNAHWATDVMAGAAVGTAAGFGVMALHRTATGRRIDRALLGVTLDAHGLTPMLGFAR